MTSEFSSTFSRINRQTSETSIATEKCFKLAQKPCGRVGKRKYNLKSALLFVVTFDENSSPFLRFLNYSYWPFWDLELVLRVAANVHTGKKTARLFKSESDGPWSCFNWLLLQQENLLMLPTAVLLWCHQLPFKWWKDSERGPAFGEKPCILRCNPFSDILKNFASKWSRTAAGKSKTSTMLPLFIDDKYRWNVFISLAVFL